MLANCLFKFSSSLVPLSAISLQTNNSALVNNLEVLSNDDLVLNPSNHLDFELNNIRYSVPSGQNQSIIRTDNNYNFMINYYFGNGAGETDVLDVSSNSNNVGMLFWRKGNFINNGITYNAGCYIVKEQY